MDGLSRQIKLLKLEIEKVRLQIENRKLLLIESNFRPSLTLPVTVRREGGHWVCIYETSEDVLECPVAYGGSPHQACANFDQLWFGSDHLIDDPTAGDEEDDNTELEGEEM